MNPTRMRGLLLILISGLFFIGCKGKGGSSSSSDRVAQAAAPDGTWVDWTPAKVEIRCAEDQTCPGQVGLLIFVEPAVKGFHHIHKCTSFLISPTQVMSNGHCDFVKGNTGYFVTALTAPGGRQMRKIVSVQAKIHTPSTDSKVPDADAGRPDVAVFTLDQPVNMAGLQLATLADPPYTKLTGYVLNPTPDKNYVIQAIVCTFRRHEAIFPYNFQENPDVLTLFNCSARKGNSGGPLFAPGSAKVQAVIQAGQDPITLASMVFEKFNRPLFNYENHYTAGATNVRCLSASLGSCVRATRELSRARFKAFQDQEFQRRRSGGALQFNEWAEILPQ